MHCNSTQWQLEQTTYHGIQMRPERLQEQQTKTAVFRDSEIIYSNLLAIQTQQMLAFKISF